MKKFTYCIILLYLQFNSLSFAWQVRVVPVYKDTMTGQWSGLFGHTAAHKCSDFNQEGQDPEQGAHCAAKILEKQTHGRYVVSSEELAKIKSRLTLDNGDVLYFVPVEYASGPELYARKQKAAKLNMVEPTRTDHYVWIPFEELLARKTIIKMARDRTFFYTFNNDIQTIIEARWDNEILPSLNAMNYKNTQKVLITKKSAKPIKDVVIAQASQRTPKKGWGKKA